MREFFAGLADIAAAIDEVVEPSVRRTAKKILNSITGMAQFTIVWLFILIIASTIFPPRIATTVVAILTFVPLLVLAWFATTWQAVVAFTALAAIPGNAALGIGPAATFLRKALKMVLLVILAVIALGVYLSIVPLSADPTLVPLLVLTMIGLILATVLLGKGLIRKLLIVIFVVLTAIFCLGGRDAAPGKAKELLDGTSATSSVPRVHEDAVCLDEHGNRKKLHYEYFPKTDFDESFPAGCGMLIAMPLWYGRHAHLQPTADSNPNSHIYVKDVGDQKYHGPYDVASDVDMHIKNPSLFFIQAAETGVKIHFSTDLEPRFPGLESGVSKLPEVPLPEARPTPTPEKQVAVREDGITPPILIRKIEPVYTKEALQASFSGKVPVDVIIDADGLPTEIKVVRSPGLGLDDNIVTAVKQWRWRAARKDGDAVALHASITVEFHLQ